MIKILSALLAIPGVIILVLAVRRTRLPYNEEGRYFDPSEDVVYHSQAVIVYVIIAALFLFVSLGLLIIGFRKPRMDKSGNN